MGRWPAATIRGAAHAAMREDDQLLLLRLFMLPAALTRQIPALAYSGRSVRSVRVHLHRLAARGLLDRLRLVPGARRTGAVKGGALWYLTPAGRQTAAAIWGLGAAAPVPLPPPTTPRGAAMGLAAAAVTEWVVQCRQVGLDVRLALPGADLGWPGWPPDGKTDATNPPPVVLARMGNSARTIAVDFVRAGGTVAARRVDLYQQILTRTDGRIGVVLVVGWGAARREPAPGVVVAEPGNAAVWAAENERWEGRVGQSPGAAGGAG